MNFLFLTNKIPYPPKDGGAIGFLNLALSLAENGHNIVLFTLNTNKHFYPIDRIPPEIKQKVNFIDVQINTDIKISKLLKNLLFSNIPYNAERFISFDYKNKLENILKLKHFDIIHIEGLYMCPYIETIRKFSKAKITFRSHNIEHEIWKRIVEDEKNFIKKLYLKNLTKRIKKFEQYFINKYDFVVPHTKREIDYYNIIGNSKPYFIAPTGIMNNNSKFTLDSSNADYPGFFQIGALDWYPNIEGLKWFLENIWTKFVIDFPNLKFKIAGRNASKKFENYLKSFPNIDYRGEVEDADKFIAEGSVMIVPLLSGSGMRIKIIEGMAAAKTIITTPIGTEGIDTLNNHNILIANNVEDFLVIMKKIVSDKSLHHKISENARKFAVDNFNNKLIAEKLCEFYTKNI